MIKSHSFVTCLFNHAVAFFFNWIGFLLLMCFCHTIASRYGALAGFGLSLTKWTLIVKHSTDLASRENSWLWWLIMAFGNYLAIRFVSSSYRSISTYWENLFFSLLSLSCRCPYLHTRHHPIPEHQTRLETPVRQCSRASALFLLRLTPMKNKTTEKKETKSIFALERLAFLSGI